MYIYDAAWGPDAANAAHIVNNPGTHHYIMVEVLDCLQLVNPYIPLYRQAHDVLHQGHISVVHLQLAVPPGVDRGCYNLPTSNEIAAILPGNNEHATSGRDLIVQLQLHNDQNQPRFQHIWETNFNYSPLMYVLLFPHGEPGWGPGLHLNNSDEGENDSDEGEAHGEGNFFSHILTVTNKMIDLFRSRS